MSTPVKGRLSGPPRELKTRIAAIVAVLLAMNGAAWLWAFASFRGFPVLLGTALLAFSLGLRHAVDADHIAAIDNVTRRLLERGRWPVCVGFFFSLGHSSIVVAGTLAIAVTATAFKVQLEPLRAIGGVIGTSLSATFLVAIALMNLGVLSQIWHTLQRVRAGRAEVESASESPAAHGGIMGRVFGSVFRLIGASWHMYPLGLLFGLGFDTATEIGLLGLSAAEGSRGLPLWSILVFPALFAAGMTLVDTLDGILMLGAYGWAFLKPIRKLYYNMTMTLFSVIVALGVGAIEAFVALRDGLGLTGSFWDMLGHLNDHFELVGIFISGIFLLVWAASSLVYRLCRLERITVKSAPQQSAEPWTKELWTP